MLLFYVNVSMLVAKKRRGIKGHHEAKFCTAFKIVDFEEVLLWGSSVRRCGSVYSAMRDGTHLY